jgi:hypothetical protein
LLFVLAIDLFRTLARELVVVSPVEVQPPRAQLGDVVSRPD